MKSTEVLLIMKNKNILTKADVPTFLRWESADKEGRKEILKKFINRLWESTTAKDVDVILKGARFIKQIVNFREKRYSETVALNQDGLNDLISEAAARFSMIVASTEAINILNAYITWYDYYHSLAAEPPIKLSSVKSDCSISFVNSYPRVFTSLSWRAYSYNFILPFAGPSVAEAEILSDNYDKKNNKLHLVLRVVWSVLFAPVYVWWKHPKSAFTYEIIYHLDFKLFKGIQLLKTVTNVKRIGRSNNAEVSFNFKEPLYVYKESDE